MPGLEINLIVPDLWQQQAVQALRAGRDVVVHAPTGAGKTYIFELLYPSLRAHEGQAVFTVPTRALANDKLAEWRSRGWDVGIATGDLAMNLDARGINFSLVPNLQIGNALVFESPIRKPQSTNWVAGLTFEDLTCKPQFSKRSFGDTGIIVTPVLLHAGSRRLVRGTGC